MHGSLERIEALFDEALERPASERGAFLDAQCGDDVMLRAEVESLLASAEALGTSDTRDPDTARSFGARVRSIMGGVAEEMLEQRAEAPRERRVGPYRVILLTAQDDRGEVYLAEREEGPHRGLVTLRLLPRRADASAVLARLRDEQFVLSTLHHPAIARMLDCGAIGDDRIYLVMEHVDGVPIERHLAGLSVRERVAFFLHVCEPIARLHQRLGAHGAIGSSNLLVTVDGQPKLLDPGFTRLLGPGGSGSTCASPEQARGEAATIASDVYALGALLYHHLAERPPRVADGDRGRAAEGELVPPRPSDIAAPRARRALAGDLDSIVMCAMREDPHARYLSVDALAEDLQRYLDGRPVLARDPTRAYLARKLVARHRGTLLIAFVTLLTLVALIGALHR